jgi:tryptophan 2,3-dioxygenase
MKVIWHGRGIAQRAGVSLPTATAVNRLFPRCRRKDGKTDLPRQRFGTMVILPISAIAPMHQSPPPVLPGSARTDYERYLRTDELLALQKRPDELSHRDELLFQTVHQSAELWLKQVAWEIEGAARQLGDGHPGEAGRLLGKARDAMACVRECTAMLRHLSPSDYRAFRPRLGNGSGFDSPGFNRIHEVSASLADQLMAVLGERSISVGGVAADRHAHPEFHAIIEHMLGIDQSLAEWRHTHFLIIQRLLGSNAVGLQGFPIEQLLGRLSHRLFPALWCDREGNASG